MSSNIVSLVNQSLTKLASKDKAKILARFFKTGYGQYGEGDKFMGVVVPNIRKVARIYYQQITLAEINKLLSSPFHEVRLCALIMLNYRFEKADNTLQKQIYDLYLANTRYINNWDLVDLSAPNIVGEYLRQYTRINESKQRVLFAPYPSGEPRRLHKTVACDLLLTYLATSKSLWERRIAMLATFAFIKAGRCDEALQIATLLQNDTHDLIHKAVGWMLREVGKRVSQDRLIQYLDIHAKTMPRTSLRYAIERFDEKVRRHYIESSRL